MSTILEDQIGEILSRTRQRYEDNLASEPQAKPDPSPAILAGMRERGYPQRHLGKLSEMHGPSLDKAVALLSRVMADDCTLLLIGDRGPGKTQMATWWGYQRALAGKSHGFYRKTADLIGEIKSTWSDKGRNEEDVLKKYRTTPLLVLDEWSEKGSSEWESRVLVNLLDHRYDAERATVIIGNMTRAQAKELIPPSILSRTEETGGIVLCHWKSYRSNL